MKDSKQYDSKKTGLVVKSNKMVNARYKLSVFEMRLIQIMVGKIQAQDEDFKTYEIPIKEFAALTGDNKSKNTYERAKETTTRLISRVMTIEEDDGPRQFGLLSEAKYLKNKGIVLLRFSPSLKPYLLNLKESFTQYNLQQTMKLSSFYSIRLYEILKQHAWKKNASVDLGVDEIKEILGISDKYRSYNTFKKKVIEKAKEDLFEHCDIFFEYKEIKEGRRVATIRFMITNRFEKITTPDISEDQLLEKLVECGVDKNQAIKLLNKYDHSQIGKAIAYTVKQNEKSPLVNFAGYLVELIKREANFDNAPIQKKGEKAAKQPIIQKEKLKERLSKEDEYIALLRSEYETFIKQEAEERITNFTDTDYQDLEEYCRLNPYLASRVFDNGKLSKKDKTAYEMALNLFANSKGKYSDDPEKGFTEWVAEKTGIHLTKDLSREHNYKIESTQKDLFQ